MSSNEYTGWLIISQTSYNTKDGMFLNKEMKIFHSHLSLKFLTLTIEELVRVIHIRGAYTLRSEKGTLHGFGWQKLYHLDSNLSQLRDRDPVAPLKCPTCTPHDSSVFIPWVSKRLRLLRWLRVNYFQAS